MKPTIAKRANLPVALALLSLALGAALALEATQVGRVERDLARIRKVRPAALAAMTILPEFTLPPIDAGFPELLSRPIFAPDRRPPAEGAAGAPGSMSKGQFVLVGVVVTPDQHSALLRDAQSGKTETVALGAQIRGMTLGEVTSDSVVLRLGSESETLPLNVQASAKGPMGNLPPPGRGMPPPGAPPGAAPPVAAGSPVASPGPTRVKGQPGAAVDHAPPPGAASAPPPATVPAASAPPAPAPASAKGGAKDAGEAHSVPPAPEKAPAP